MIKVESIISFLRYFCFFLYNHQIIVVCGQFQLSNIALRIMHELIRHVISFLTSVVSISESWQDLKCWQSSHLFQPYALLPRPTFVRVGARIFVIRFDRKEILRLAAFVYHIQQYKSGPRYAVRSLNISLYCESRQITGYKCPNHWR